MTRPVTSRATVQIGTHRFTRCETVSVARDLQNIAGTFDISVIDDARLFAALPSYIGDRPTPPPIQPNDLVTIALDGEPVLIGWIEKLKLNWGGEQIGFHISGRDKTGTLVEAAALPEGPAEFRNVDLLHVARKVCEPYGIGVTADVDLGEKFDHLALHKHQTALDFLESAARQRAVLLTSDGIGGLLLTRGGKTRAPAALRIGENIQDLTVEFDWTHRFSDYYVFQQSERVQGGAAALDHSVAPLDDDAAEPLPGRASEVEATRIVMTGHARDPEFKRYRPTARMTRTQSGMSTVQEQAEWLARVSKGQSDRVHVPVLDWRAGKDKALWRPNALAAVFDPYSQIDRDMLIAGVHYEFDDRGYRTTLRLAGPSAYDRINESERRRRHNRPHHGAPGRLDATVIPLTAGEGPTR